jgi:hypothetical protein
MPKSTIVAITAFRICHGIVQGHRGLEDVMLFWFVERVSGRSYLIEANNIFNGKDSFSN